jgi:hypothetical protein
VNTAGKPEEGAQLGRAAMSRPVVCPKCRRASGVGNPINLYRLECRDASLIQAPHSVGRVGAIARLPASPWLFDSPYMATLCRDKIDRVAVCVHTRRHFLLSNTKYFTL